MSDISTVAEVGARHVGTRIQQYRRRADLTQAELGQMLDWGEAAQVRISNYERGRRTPGLDDLQQLAAALRVDLATLVAGVDLPRIKQPSAEPDSRRNLVRLFDSLSVPARHAALQYIKELAEHDNADRAAVAAELHRVANLSSPRTRALVESLAHSIAAGKLADEHADVLALLVELLARKSA